MHLITKTRNHERNAAYSFLSFSFLAGGTGISLSLFIGSGLPPQTIRNAKSRNTTIPRHIVEILIMAPRHPGSFFVGRQLLLRNAELLFHSPNDAQAVVPQLWL